MSLQLEKNATLFCLHKVYYGSQFAKCCFDTCHERKTEIAAKLERIRRMLDENDLQGVLLTNHDNFSWVGNVPQQLVEKYQACLEIETVAMGQTRISTIALRTHMPIMAGRICSAVMAKEVVRVICHGST